LRSFSGLSEAAFTGVGAPQPAANKASPKAVVKMAAEVRSVLAEDFIEYPAYEVRRRFVSAPEFAASLADEDAWKRRFAEKRDVIRRMAREALEEDERGETLPLDNLL